VLHVVTLRGVALCPLQAQYVVEQQALHLRQSAQWKSVILHHHAQIEERKAVLLNGEM
jgi:hypothetical protein